jgi:hypothetical protein
MAVKIGARFFWQVLLRAVILLVAANLLFAASMPLPVVGKWSAYNTMLPGRPRLPFGERPDVAYNLSLYSLDAMIASHEVMQPRPADEYRVIVLGDSSVWGTLLRPDETLAGQINAAGLYAPDGRRIRAYNLGYPTISVTKDLLILSLVIQRQPDMILWPVTLEALPRHTQLRSPILQNNSQPVRDLAEAYGLNLETAEDRLIEPNFWQRTILGQRRNLADIIRLQMYGVMWAATGIDQYYPESYNPTANDLEADQSFRDLQPPDLSPDDLALDVLAAGHAMAKGIPLLLINEPVFISSGENSDIRYNFFYPKWAYDDYRQILLAEAQQNGWHYVDAWDLIAPSDFTNSAIHLTPGGSAQFAQAIIPYLVELVGEVK